MTAVLASRARAGLLAVAVLLGALPVAVSTWSHQGVVSRLEAASQGEGQLMLDAVRLAARPELGTPLEDVQAALSGHGLLWIAVLEPLAGEVVAEAGEPRAPRSRLPRPGEDFLMFESTARLAAAPPPPPPGVPDFPLPAIVIEYEPRQSLELLRRSRMALGASVGGALLLWTAAIALWRLSGRAAAQQAEVERHRHLASLGQVSAVLAHEIKNPLAALKGHAQLLARQVPAEQVERAERVVGEARRLEELVESLLDFARTATVKREEVDPVALANEVAAGRIAVNAEGAPRQWSLDPLRMRQLLGNLVENALLAAPEGAELRVEVAGDELAFVVRDRGPGIVDPERIFEPFYTTRARGTGLGLAVVRRVATLHGGTVAASNHPEGGAELRVVVPRS